MSNIITQYEVIRYSPAPRDFPPGRITERIPLVEQTIGREKLGYDLFLAMVADLNAVPTGEQWVDCGDYALDDVVLKNGVYYISTAANNNTDPELEGSDWDQYNKFQSACYNTMWTDYLRGIFAYSVYSAALPFATLTADGAGLVVQEKDDKGRRAAKKSEITAMQSFLKQEMDAMWRNLNAWLFNTDAGKACAETLPDCLLLDGRSGPAESIRQRRVMYRY